MAKTVVVGLDGAHWELIKPWLRDGHLPNIAELRRRGSWGDLRSCLPPVTCPNWRCYSTGRNPGKLGAFWWELVDKDRRRISTVNADVFETPDIWDYLAFDGRSSAVINMPTTYPPREVDGQLIAGGPDAELSGYTYPPKLEQELKSRYSYEVRPHDIGRLPGAKDEICPRILDLIETRFEVTLDRLDEFDFVHLTIFYINVLQHFYWRDDVVRDGWKLIDDYIGALLDGDYNVIIMSDHGSNEIRQVFNINCWLENEGYLTLRRSSTDLLSNLNLTKDRLRNLTMMFGNGPYRLLRDAIPESIVGRLPNSEGVSRSGKADKIDWDDSIAFAGGQGPIYLLTSKNSVRRKLRKSLESVEGPLGYDSPLKSVHLAENVYGGSRMRYAPGLVVEQNPGWHIAGGVGIESIFADPTRWKAENKRNGLFIVAGPDFNSKAGAEKELDILDLAPTILNLYGLPIPGGMDGTVASDLYASDSSASTSPEIVDEYVNLSEGTQPSKMTAESRLQDLGYLE